jgi:hypothetical protein
LRDRDFVPEWEEGDFSLGGRRGIFLWMGGGGFPPWVGRAGILPREGISPKSCEREIFPGCEVRDFFLVERGIFPRVGKMKIPPPLPGVKRGISPYDVRRIPQG